jgi:hypothetical protein
MAFCAYGSSSRSPPQRPKAHLVRARHRTRCRAVPGFPRYTNTRKCRAQVTDHVFPHHREDADAGPSHRTTPNGLPCACAYDLVLDYVAAVYLLFDRLDVRQRYSLLVVDMGAGGHRQLFSTFGLRSTRAVPAPGVPSLG